MIRVRRRRLNWIPLPLPPARVPALPPATPVPPAPPAEQHDSIDGWRLHEMKFGCLGGSRRPSTYCVADASNRGQELDGRASSVRDLL